MEFSSASKSVILPLGHVRISLGQYSAMKKKLLNPFIHIYGKYQSFDISNKSLFNFIIVCTEILQDGKKGSYSVTRRNP